MPVSTFWVKAEIDGRRKALEAGPEADDGGIRLEITQRNEGLVERPLVIEGEAIGEGLVLRVWDDKGEMIYAHCTTR